MAKPDYKHSAAPKQKQPKPSILMPFTAGVCCGVFASFLTYLYLGQAPIQQVSNISPPPQVTLQPAKPNKPLNNPSYEFYTMLDKQEPLPTYQPPVKPKSKVIPPTAKKVQQATKPSGKYIIQIQSFNSKKSAQGLRGVLILQNYKDVFIQEVSLKNQTWYRVNMGPFQSKQQARSVQKSLQQYATMIKTIKS